MKLLSTFLFSCLALAALSLPATVLGAEVEVMEPRDFDNAAKSFFIETSMEVTDEMRESMQTTLKFVDIIDPIVTKFKAALVRIVSKFPNLTGHDGDAEIRDSNVFQKVISFITKGGMGEIFKAIKEEAASLFNFKDFLKEMKEKLANFLPPAELPMCKDKRKQNSLTCKWNALISTILIYVQGSNSTPLLSGQPRFEEVHASSTASAAQKKQQVQRERVAGNGKSSFVEERTLIPIAGATRTGAQNTLTDTTIVPAELVNNKVANNLYRLQYPSWIGRLFISDIWFRLGSNGKWQWSADKGIWMSVSTLVCSGGKYKGQKPVTYFAVIINRLNHLETSRLNNHSRTLSKSTFDLLGKQRSDGFYKVKEDVFDRSTYFKQINNEWFWSLRKHSTLNPITSFFVVRGEDLGERPPMGACVVIQDMRYVKTGILHAIPAAPEQVSFVASAKMTARTCWEAHKKNGFKPSLAVRGYTANIAMGVVGLEQVHDFARYEVGYFFYKGLVAGTSSVSAGVLGYQGFGFKGDSHINPLMDAYSAYFTSFEFGASIPLANPVVSASISGVFAFSSDSKHTGGILADSMLCNQVITMVVGGGISAGPDAPLTLNVASTYYHTGDDFVIKCAKSKSPRLCMALMALAFPHFPYSFVSIWLQAATADEPITFGSEMRTN